MKRTILDCSTLLPGPLMGKLLLQQGARVIKIENPHLPDGAKNMGSFYDDLNEGKEVISLDLTPGSPGLDSKDRVRFSELVKKADGLIEGFRPRAKLKLGLDEASLHKINPKLCILSLVGYPENGPSRERAGHDLNFSALTGLASLFHEMPALPLADLFSSYSGALSLMAAMDQVTRLGGKGTRVVISMSETLRAVQSCLIRQFKDDGVIPRPGETLFSGKYPCYRIYQCKDGRRISVGAIENKFWKKVCEIIGTPHLVTEGYSEGKKRLKVIAEVERAFQERNWKEWSPVFEKEDCCVEPILDYSEVYGV